jgi:hypothetical protein
MKSRTLMFVTAMILFLFLALAPTALASNAWYVDGVHGSNNNNCKSRQHACRTIGHAISLASSGDSIMVAAAKYTENLTISFSLNIVGSSAKTTIIDGGGVSNVVQINSGSVTLAELTIRNGASNFGAGIYNFGVVLVDHCIVRSNAASGTEIAYGGGISNNGGAVTINNSTISGNTSYAILSAFGGGIEVNTGAVTINNSTISDNSVTGGSERDGGGISNYGELTVNNSTIRSNTAGAGGGIFNQNGTVTITNSTVVRNRTVGQLQLSGGGGIFSQSTVQISNSTISRNSATALGSLGGGIVSSGGTAVLRNSVVANNRLGGNCSGDITSRGYNLSSDNSCNFDNTGDLNNADPKLGQLGNYGGPTETIPLLDGSPAIDSGNPSGCTDSQGHLLKTDQRGKPRPDREDKRGCDMGAYERQKD